MKNPKSLVLVAAVFLASVAKAQSPFCDANGRNCFSPPQPPFTYSAAAQAFFYADAPWPEDLAGSWKIVGSGQDPVDYPLQVITEESNGLGVALDPIHSSETAILSFNASFTIPGQRDLQANLRVQNRTSGATDPTLSQGPFVVSLGEAQACFAISYGTPMQVPGQGVFGGYEDYSCKTIRRTGDLICRLVLRNNFGRPMADGYQLLSPAQ